MPRSKRKAPSEHSEAPTPKTSKVLSEVEALKQQLAETQKQLNEKNKEARVEERVANAQRYLRLLPRIFAKFGREDDKDSHFSETITSVTTTNHNGPRYYINQLLRQGCGIHSGFEVVAWVFADGSRLSFSAHSYDGQCRIHYVGPKKKTKSGQEKHSSIGRGAISSLSTSNAGLPLEVIQWIAKEPDTDAGRILIRFGAKTINLMLASVCLKEPFFDFLDHHRGRHLWDINGPYTGGVSVEIMFDYPMLVLCGKLTSNIWWGHGSQHHEARVIPAFLSDLISFYVAAEFSRLCSEPPNIPC